MTRDGLKINVHLHGAQIEQAEEFGYLGLLVWEIKNYIRDQSLQKGRWGGHWWGGTGCKEDRGGPRLEFLALVSVLGTLGWPQKRLLKGDVPTRDLVSGHGGRFPACNCWMLPRSADCREYLGQQSKQHRRHEETGVLSSGEVGTAVERKWGGEERMAPGQFLGIESGALDRGGGFGLSGNWWGFKYICMFRLLLNAHRY